MIEEYLRQIDELLSINPAVREVEIVRRSVRDTDFETVSQGAINFSSGACIWDQGCHMIIRRPWGALALDQTASLERSGRKPDHR